MAASRQKPENIDNTDSLPYWMGRIDATIGEMKASIDNFGKKNESQWAEFDAWRRQVDERLQSGSARFEDHGRRLLTLEEKANGNGKNGNGKPKFGTWEWFRESYLEKGLYIILSLALYKIVEALIMYWAKSI